MPQELSDIDMMLSGAQSPTVPADDPIAPPNTPEPVEAPDVELESEPSTPELETPAENVDEYGNEAPAPKMYSEEEVRERINKAIRKRLKEAETPTTPQPQPQYQQQQSQLTDPDDWQQQLKQFVRETLQEDVPTILQQQQMREAQRQQQMKEQVLQQQFEEKFVSGMERFSDFQAVVGSQPITDAMTYALRGVQDPASFIYAASKRHAAELQRIAQIPDAYGQMVEMGRLEERMRKAKATTTAAAPLTKTAGDVTERQLKAKSNSVDDLLAAADARRLAERRAR